MVYNETTGVKTPKDLEGKRVGARSHTVTPIVWARGIPPDGPRRRPQAKSPGWPTTRSTAPSTCRTTRRTSCREIGADLNKKLEAGDIVANMGAYNGEDPHIKPFYPDPEPAPEEFYQKYGVFPIDHLVVLKDSVIKEHPWLPKALYEALDESKDEALKKDPHAHIGGNGIMEGDPLPYGLEANRKALQMLLDLCYDQDVLRKPMTLEELFPLGF